MTAYQQQLRDKTDCLKKLFQGLDFPEIEVFESPEQHYRVRAELRIWHEGGEMFYAIFKRGQRTSGASPTRRSQFPTASESIDALMPRFVEAAAQDSELKNRWYAAEFLSALNGEMLVTMIYHKKLGKTWQRATKILMHELGIRIVGRSREQKIVLTQGYITEELNVNGRTFRYHQVGGSFTQPNARACEEMFGWTCDAARNLSGNLLGLYCGSGSFTLPLSQYFRQVLATEVPKTSVYAARWNVGANRGDDIKIARLSAEEFTKTYMQSREFHRLQEQDILLKDYVFSAVLADPPRAGVDEETLKPVSQFDNIIYIPYNPGTLHANLDILCRTHTVKRVALFGQFPFTHHIESGVWLERRLK